MLGLFFGWNAHALDQDQLRQLPEAGYQPNWISYWGSPYFANALVGGRWIEFSDFEWGDDVYEFQNPQFDENGFPKYLNPGKKLRALVWPLHANYASRPESWPDRSRLAVGRWVISWEGEADVRLNHGAFVAPDSSGGEFGSLENGRRAYQVSESNGPGWIEIHVINPEKPLRNLRVWLPDPADPNRALENQLLHPVFLARLADRDWGYIRFMDWIFTNGTPERDWSDRRLPAHCFQSGILNRRSPAEDAIWYYDNGNPVFAPGDRATGVAYEHIVSASNAASLDLWITVPHLTVESVDAYITKLAKLISYGSDGVNPYDSPQADPVHPPLRSDLKVYLEYSNEIWAGNNDFPQGIWAQSRAEELGIEQSQFNARQFSRVWQEFENVLGRDRIVRVAAVFTGLEYYTRAFIDEFYNEESLLEPDLLAVTTYFANNIQFWVKDNITRIEGKKYTDPYWNDSPELEADLHRTILQWKRYILSETAYGGDGGRDTTDVGGGFPPYINDIAHERNLPIVAYEGGPSVYLLDPSLDGDGGSPDDDEVTMFMEALNRHPGFTEVYRINLEFAKWHKLWTHTPYHDSSRWGRYGQWGHVESLDQPLNEAPKYQFLLDWAAEHESIRHPNDPQGEVPVFATSARAPYAVSGHPYDLTLEASGGDGPLHWKIISELLPAGLSYDAQAHRVTGVTTVTSQETGWIFARVTDAGGDPAWRLFTFTALEPSHGVDIEPIDDASVVLWERELTHGGENRLWIVGHSSFDWGAFGYFKFDLGSVRSLPLASAFFRFHVIEGSDGAGSSSSRFVAHSTGDAWDEQTLLAANGPEIGARVSPTLAIPSAGDYSLDLTDYIPNAVGDSDPYVSFVIENDPAAHFHGNMASKEHATLSWRPRLHLTFATQTLEMISVSGRVRYYAGDKALRGVNVSVTGDGTRSAVTGDEGRYAFELDAGRNYVVRPHPVEESASRRGGVTTLDIALIRRHILATERLDSPYKVLAADVNESQSISTLDIALIRRFILGIIDEMPGGSWLFVPSEFDFGDPLRPWPADSRREFSILENDMENQDFIGVKRGDVNGSWTPP